MVRHRRVPAFVAPATALFVVALVVMASSATPAQAVAPPLPPPPPPTVSPIAADAGYFLAEGTCPAATHHLSFQWTNASNGAGWADIAGSPGNFSTAVRMLASGPGQSIDVTVRCVTSSGTAAATWGPISVASGVDLLAEPPAGSGTGRRIVYSLSAQQLWAVEADGTVARTHLVSGRRLSIAGGRSQLGVFSVYEKRLNWACGGGCPFFLAFHRTRKGVVGFHEIPRTRQGPYQPENELGQPRSHGCVRQSHESATWLYNWAVVGDVAMVVP